MPFHLKGGLRSQAAASHSDRSCGQDPPPARRTAESSRMPFRGGCSAGWETSTNFADAPSVEAGHGSAIDGEVRGSPGANVKSLSSGGTVASGFRPLWVSEDLIKGLPSMWLSSLRRLVYGKPRSSKAIHSRSAAGGSRRNSSISKTASFPRHSTSMLAMSTIRRLRQAFTV